MQNIIKILNAGLAVVDGEKVVLDALKISNNKLKIENKAFDLNQYKSIYVLGAGKVAGRMAIGTEKALGNRIKDGLIVAKEKTSGLEKIDQIIGGHPVPDKKSLIAGKKILEFAYKASENDLVIFLLSGGASSLMVAPKGVSLAEKQRITEQLLGCGADIKEINAIRKYLSEIKGGGLAQAIYPATCVALVISDVSDDDLSVIGSGPTVQDKTTVKDCIKIMQKYGLHKKSQKAFWYFKQVSETRHVQRDKEVFSKMYNYIIASLDTAFSAAGAEAKRLGYKIKIQGKVSGVASDVGKNYAKEATLLKTGECLVGGGETTVVVRGKGRGGRNLELVMGFLDKVKELDGIEFLSINSDGEDGTSGVAGAIVTEKVFTEAKKLDINKYLKNNNSLAFFQKTSGIITISKNQTNVGDIQIILKN